MPYRRYFALKFRDQSLHSLALEVLLRPAQIARYDWILLSLGESRYLGFPAISQGTNYRVAAVVAAKQRRHGLERPAEKQIQQKGFQNIVGVMPERDLSAAFFDCHVVQDSPAKPRAQCASGLAFCHYCFHDRVRVALDDSKRHIDRSKVFGQ